VSRWKDTLGIAASVGCAIHCAATPILIAFLPALKLTEWMASPAFHQIAALVCCSLVAIAIWPAFRKFRDYNVLALSSAGLGLVVSAAFFLPDHCCDHDHTEDGSSASGMKLVSFSPLPESKVCTDACCQNNVFAARRAAMMGTGPSADPLFAGSINRESNDAGPIKAENELSSVTSNDGLEPIATSQSDQHEHVPSFWATMQPWMTPLGGLLLVLAHGLNLRRSLSGRTCSTGCKCAKSGVTQNDIKPSSENTIAA
jgi:hypothetical protein